MHREAEHFLVQIFVSPCHLARCTTQEAMVLFVREEKDYLLDQFFGGKEREEENAGKPFCTIDRRKKGAE